MHTLIKLYLSRKPVEPSNLIHNYLQFLYICNQLAKTKVVKFNDLAQLSDWIHEKNKKCSTLSITQIVNKLLAASMRESLDLQVISSIGDVHQQVIIHISKVLQVPLAARFLNLQLSSLGSLLILAVERIVHVVITPFNDLLQGLRSHEFQSYGYVTWLLESSFLHVVLYPGGQLGAAQVHLEDLSVPALQLDLDHFGARARLMDPLGLRSIWEGFVLYRGGGIYGVAEILVCRPMEIGIIGLCALTLELS